MKWIAIFLFSALSEFNAEATSPCQQAKDLHKSVQEKHRTGYGIKESKRLRCLKRFARNAITKYCRASNQAKRDSISVSRIANQHCASER